MLLKNGVTLTKYFLNQYTHLVDKKMNYPIMIRNQQNPTPH